MMGHLPVHKERCPGASSGQPRLSQTAGAAGGGGPSGGGADPRHPQGSVLARTRSAATKPLWMHSRGRLVSFDRRLGYEGRWRREPCACLRL